MAADSNPQTDVLQSDHHSTLTSEEIAKAVARHNRQHPAVKAENPQGKAKKSTKK